MCVSCMYAEVEWSGFVVFENVLRLVVWKKSVMCLCVCGEIHPSGKNEKDVSRSYSVRPYGASTSSSEKVPSPEENVGIPSF
mmetsp:Transcript_4989/g.5989  ORF Transcript_4989/g.5989 Transcript_4989/m.5989 type:complete len:82 (+) Transcript_4989:60-305(+)